MAASGVTAGLSLPPQSTLSLKIVSEWIKAPARLAQFAHFMDSHVVPWKTPSHPEQGAEKSGVDSRSFIQRDFL